MSAVFDQELQCLARLANGVLHLRPGRCERGLRPMRGPPTVRPEDQSLLWHSVSPLATPCPLPQPGTPQHGQPSLLPWEQARLTEGVTSAHRLSGQTKRVCSRSAPPHHRTPGTSSHAERTPGPR